MRRITTIGSLLAALCAAPALHAQTVVCSGTILSWSLSNPEYAATCNCSNGEDAMPVCGGGGAGGGARITSFFNYGQVSFTPFETGAPFVSRHYSDNFADYDRETVDRCQVVAGQVENGEYPEGDNLGKRVVNKFYRMLAGVPGVKTAFGCSAPITDAAAAFSRLLLAHSDEKPRESSENAFDSLAEIPMCNFSQTMGEKSIAPSYGMYYRSLSGQAETTGLRIEQFPDDRAVFTDANNVRWTFRQARKDSGGDSYYRAPPGSPYQLARNDRGFRVETPEGDSIDFLPAPEAGNWRSSRYNSADGSWLAYTYGPNGLARITDMHGRYFVFERDAKGLPLTVTDHNGKKSVLAYDAAGNLTSAIYPDGYKKTFAYEAGRMVAAKAGGLAEVHYTYDGKGRVLSSESEGGVNRLEHYYNDAASKTVITDGLGNKTEYSHVSDHGQKLVTGVTDALGGKAAMSYDGNFNLASATDQLGHTTKYVRNSNGDPETVVDALGSTTTIQYQVKRQYRDYYGERTDHYSRPIKITDPLGHLTRLDYDSYGNLAKTEDALGNKTWMAYDKAGHMLELRDALGATYKFEYANGLSKSVDPLGRVTSYKRDADLQVTQLTDPLGRNTTFTYDLSGNVTSVTNPQNFVTRFSYGSGACPSCGGSQLSALTDPKGNTWTFGYDQYGRLTNTANPLGQQKVYAYDKMSRVTEVKDPAGNITAYTYDGLNRLTKKDIQTPAGVHAVTDYTYDAVGNLLSASNGESTVSFVYDALNRAVETTQAFAGNSYSISYAYDAVGNRTSMTTPWGKYSYTYDALNRVTGIVNPQGINVSFGYDAIGRRTSKKMFKTTPELLAETAYTYDAAGQLLSIVNKAGGKVVAFANYEYDAAGNRVKKEDQDGTIKYRYDASNRLITAEPVPMNMPEAEVFIYDKNGNRRYDRGAWDYKYDADNRLLENSTYTYTHDLNGNLTGRAKKDDNSAISYAYNPEQQLSEVITPEHKSKYKYEPLGRRIEKTVDGNIQRYVYYNEDIIAILDGNNTATETFTHGPGIDEPLAMTKPDGNNYYYHADGLGSINTLTDDNNQIVESYAYKAYGAPTIKNRDGAVADKSTIGNPYLFTARELDSESGLYYLRFRYYDWRRGAFMQEDPIGFSGGDVDLYIYGDSVGKVQEAKHGSTNLYQYAFNGPLNYVDPDGASPIRIGWLLRIFNGWANPANAPAVGEPTYSPVITDEELEDIMSLGIAYYGFPLVNHNRYFRIGPGRKFGRKTFRMAGQCVEKVTGKPHIDLWPGGPL